MLRFLLLRRHIDPLLLSIAMAFLVVRLGLEILFFGFFVGVGIYLVAGLHRSARYFDRTYAIAAGLYALGALLIGLVHGNLSEEIRWIGYPVYLLFGIFLAPGMVLIKDPLRQIVLGARAGLLLAVTMGGLELLSGVDRAGLGGNAATAAFVLVIAGILARISVPEPWRYLPNSRLWFYLAGLAVVMTGTRSLAPIFVLSLAFDLVAARRQVLNGAARVTFKRAVAYGLIALLAVGAASYELTAPIAKRVDNTMEDLSAAMEGGEGSLTSLTIRLVLWEKVIGLIQRNPLIGAGGADSMDQIRRAIPPEERAVFQRFNHVHNFLMDELRLRGIIGLLLMLGFFAATTGKLLARGTGAIREATVLFLGTLLLYGTLHGLLLADRNVALIAIFLSVLLLHLRKEAFRARLHPQAQPKTA